MTKEILNKVGDWNIVLFDGTTIEFYHSQDCYEDVYADLNSLNDTGFKFDKSITKDNLKIEFVDGYGIKINGYGIACYNNQNGYYNSDISIVVKNNKKVIYETKFDASEYGENGD